jgi:glycogen synthase
VLRSRAIMEEMRNNCDALKNEFGDNLFRTTAMGISPRFEKLVDDYWLLRLRRTAYAWKTSRLPLLTTHELLDEGRDEVLGQIHSAMLFNLADHPVKVVYHPDFITATNPLFGMDYDQFVRGCHLGIFPSFYEPWGYTPLECVARGVPSVTSDLSGFGTYLLENMPDCAERGLFVVRRRGRSFDAAASELTDWLFKYLKLDRRDRIDLRNKVEGLSEHFDWQNLGRYYAEAHKLALDRARA